MALGFYFDMTRCIGCRACQVTCKDKNRLDVGVVIRNAKTYVKGSCPDIEVFNYSATCNHCEDPACVRACPTGAMYKAEDGTVLHDDALCISCKSCVEACPYGAPRYDDVTNMIRKCDACAALRAKGQKPACVDACPMRALDFGDMDELKEKYGPDLVSNIAILPDSGATGPNLLIKAKKSALSGDFTEMPL